MGHALRLYFPGGMRELGDFGAAGGLDKISVVAPKVVQYRNWGGEIRKGRGPWNPTLAQRARGYRVGWRGA
jgi:hypothetical protein